MVVAVRAVFVSFLELFDLLSKHLFALLTGKNHFGGSFQLVILSFFVALRAVEPLSAARSTDGTLSVEDVFAHLNYY